MARGGMLVAVTGYATSGKDTFADFLVEDHGYVKIAWPDPLYELCQDIDPLLWYPWRGWRRLSSILNELGWHDAKKIDSVRRLLQNVGTSVRERLGDDVFVRHTIERAEKLMQKGKHVVISSTRFANEAKAVLELGGTVIKVSRPGVGPVNEHISDQGEAFKYAMMEVANNGSLDDLHRAASRIHATILAEHTQDMHAIVSPEVYVARMEQTVARCIGVGIKAIVSMAAPERANLKEYSKRHRLEMVTDEECTTVLVDGEEAGVVAYEDGVLVLEAYIAR